MPLHVLGTAYPSSGGSAQLLFGVTMCVGCVLAVCGLQFHHNPHAVNTHLTHAITPNSSSAERPKHVEALTLNEKLRKVYQVGVDSLTECH
jgi:hypothetical protein